METASNKYDQVLKFKLKLATSETLFDNTTFFYSIDGMFD